MFKSSLYKSIDDRADRCVPGDCLNKRLIAVLRASLMSTSAFERADVSVQDSEMLTACCVVSEEADADSFSLQ